MKVMIDRLGTVWWRDCYEIPEGENGKPDKKALQDAINDVLPVEWSEPLSESWDPGDAYEVWNEEFTELIEEYPND